MMENKPFESLTTKDFRDEISAVIRSRAPLVYVETVEEKRFLEFIAAYAKKGNYEATIWDCYQGVIDLITKKRQSASLSSDPEDGLSEIVKSSERIATSGGICRLNIMLDFHRFLDPCRPKIERILRTICRSDFNSVVFLVGPKVNFPPALEKDIRLIEFPLPTSEELKSSVNEVVNSVSGRIPSIVDNTENNIHQIVNSLSGLTITEATAAVAKSIVMHKEIQPNQLLKEKKSAVKKSGALEYLEVNVGSERVGGMSNLMNWLKIQSASFDPRAEDFGLPIPKGILLVGPPGVGKSLVAKTISGVLNTPLLRLDFGALFNQYVGESERATRNALRLAERINHCTLWIDEIDKGLHAGGSRGDSGVTNRVIGTVLTWMQEKQSPVFVVGTANNPRSLPPELMRAGRFDEIFFIDIPNLQERKQIFEALLNWKKRDPSDFDLDLLGSISKGYTGAEIEKSINQALKVCFIENMRKLETKDITTVIKSFKPLSVTRAEEVQEARVWAEKRCIFANSPDDDSNGDVRHIDI